MAKIFKNDFSWSYSRHGTFKSCLRRYYLCYYGSWGGWEAGAPPATRETYIQKKLTTLPMWLGSVVHGAAESALKGLMESRPLGPEKLLARTLQQARNEIQDSERGGWRQSPSRVTAFQEHYYQESVEPAAFEAQVQEIGRQVGVLADTPVYRRLVEVPTKLREVERLASMDIDGVPVWVKLDALVDDGRGGSVVIDWKTGASHERESISTQLGIYGLYCEKVFGVPPERITTMHVNLRSGTQERHPVDREVLQGARAFILESAREMRALLSDARENQARIEEFPMLPEGSRSCGRCPFRRTCGREQADPQPQYQDNNP